MQLRIPDFALVALIGVSGSGKSSFAARHFLLTEILSSDRLRGWVADDETDQNATPDAFQVLHFIAGKRLAARRLTVVDATNVRPEDRRLLVDLARRYHALPVAIVLDMPEALCIERNKGRPDRDFGAHVVRNQVRLLHRSIRGLQREGFRHVFTLGSPEEAEAAVLARDPLYTDRRDDHGPFDIIGDIHGCHDELTALLEKLGYRPREIDGRVVPVHESGRRVIFLGDLVDRGPKSPEVLRLAMDMVKAGKALCVQGNHESRLVRKLNGKNVQIAHGLAETMAQLEALHEDGRAAFIEESRRFMDDLRSHYWLDGGRLVVAHAGLKEEMHGRGSGAVRSFALYGETTGETDEFGLPVRFNWASEYRGKATVVYGHVPTPVAEWVNRTICVDTGCVFGGKLTALRYPELELVDVPAARVYSEPVRPLVAQTAGRSAQQEADALLDLAEVSGKRTITTAIYGHVRIEPENATAALEVMSRFAIDPRWLIYLPPTMSPSETSAREGLLEHPEEALAHFERAGVARVIAEEKHMGSRAVLVVARDHAAALSRFGVPDDRIGRIYTRTGRPFFKDDALEQSVMARVAAAASAAGLWEQLGSDWLCLDAELMPWSAKAQGLIAEQYRPVAVASGAATAATVAALQQAVLRGVDAAPLLARMETRAANAAAYAAAVDHYIWPVAGIDDLKLAPFHVLASEGKVHIDRGHDWHMATAAALAAADPALLVATPHRVVALADAEARAALCDWWTELTGRGGEGLVLKPLDFVTRSGKGLVQPALKCRGCEYLRIIYGPDYTMPEHLERLRERGLGGKRALALKEFALGIEGLERFVRREPLRRVHECVFGVLALESQPIDPRL